MFSDALSRELIEPLPALQKRAEHAFPQLSPPVPDHALLCFGHPFLAEAKRLTSANSKDTFAGEQELFKGVWNDTAVLMVATGVGSPAAAMVTEKLVAAGSEILVGVGFCGGLRVPRESCVIPTEIHGQPGVTHAYGIPHPQGDDGILDGLAATAHAQQLRCYEGPHWTTDAIYRETESRVNRYRKRGCLGVDMETAGMYVAAQHRDARAGALLVVTDTLDKKWRPLTKLPRDLVDNAVRACLTALCP